jgi:hypothetical protein
VQMAVKRQHCPTAEQASSGVPGPDGARKPSPIRVLGRRSHMANPSPWPPHFGKVAGAPPAKPWPTRSHDQARGTRRGPLYKAAVASRTSGRGRNARGLLQAARTRVWYEEGPLAEGGARGG